MKQLLFALLILVSFQSCFSQDFSKKEVDSLYKEDQFFIGVTYNLFGKEPSGLKQSGFSLGFHLGVIKDIPLNKRRDLAFGIGLGYSVNTFNNNCLL